MKIYDISQEIFGCEVYPGDPAPELQQLKKIPDGSIYNLTSFSMCTHNGTHIDAPKHFYNNGKTVDQISLDHFVGAAYVIYHKGKVAADDAIAMIVKAKETDPCSAKRILIKGKAVITSEAAKVFAEAGVLLIGNESQTVGSEEDSMEVHLKLLGADIVILEGIRLTDVSEGVYLLNAAPINLGGCEGAPCRAILIDIEG